MASLPCLMFRRTYPYNNRRRAERSVIDEEADPQKVLEVHGEELHGSPDTTSRKKLKRFPEAVAPEARPQRFENVSVSQTAKDIDGEVLRAGLLGKVEADFNVTYLLCVAHISLFNRAQYFFSLENVFFLKTL